MLSTDLHPSCSSVNQISISSEDFHKYKLEICFLKHYVPYRLPNLKRGMHTSHKIYLIFFFSKINQVIYT